MKKYLLNTLLFAVVCLVLAFGLDVIISSRLRQDTSCMFSYWNHIFNDTTNYDLVVNGNSRALNQYDPMILDSILIANSYNFGMGGSSINRQIIKYIKYCDLHVPPKCLVQNIDLFTMTNTMGYQREQFFAYFFKDRKLINELDLYERFSLAEKYVPCYRYLGYDIVIREALLRNSFPDDFSKKGYCELNEEWNGVLLSEMDSVLCSCDTNAIKIFEDFLNEVTNEGTKVIFVYAPIYHEVREKMINEQQMFEMYDTIAQRFNIPILDYNDISMCYDTTYFYNGTHLNKLGAELFTTKLAHDIDSLGLLK